MIAVQKPQKISFDKLKLWSENPREPLEGDFSNNEIISLAIIDKNNKFKIQSLIDEFGEYVDFGKMPTVVKTLDNRYLVMDGNRRLIYILALQNKDLRKELFDNHDIPFDISQIEEMTETWCNVCSMETAIEIVYKNHAHNGSWNQLERDYFMTNYKGQEKSIYIHLEEQAGLIAADKSMNQVFVKEEILTANNLKKLGFEFDSTQGFTSNYNTDVANKIMKAVVDSVKHKHIDTRKNRGKLLETIKEHYPDTSKLIKNFDSKKPINVLQKFFISKDIPDDAKKRRSKKATGSDKLFGKNLILAEGSVNNAYLGLDRIYEKFKSDDATYLFIGAGLRVLLELAGRAHYAKEGDGVSDSDSIAGRFLADAKKAGIDIPKPTLTYLAIVDNWIQSKGSNYTAILHKFAHGQLPTGKVEILESSYVVGAILEHYHKR